MTTTVASLGGSPFLNTAVSATRIRQVGSLISKKKSKIVSATTEYSLVSYYDEDGGNSEIVRINKDGSYVRISESMDKMAQLAGLPSVWDRLKKSKKINFIIGIT